MSNGCTGLRNANPRNHTRGKEPHPAEASSQKSAISVEKAVWKEGGGFDTSSLTEMPVTGRCQNLWNPKLGNKDDWRGQVFPVSSSPSFLLHQM